MEKFLNHSTRLVSECYQLFVQVHALSRLHSATAPPPPLIEIGRLAPLATFVATGPGFGNIKSVVELVVQERTALTTPTSMSGSLWNESIGRIAGRPHAGRTAARRPPLIWTAAHDMYISRLPTRLNQVQTSSKGLLVELVDVGAEPRKAGG